ncbi:MAG: restriction endonuclease [Methanocella sp.]
MSNNLLDVIAEIFSTYNYSVSAKKKNFDLFAEKPNNNVAIKVLDTPSTDDIKTIADAISNDGGAKCLIVSMAFFSEDVKKAAKQKEIMIWDRPELEKQIGKAVLMRLDIGNDPFASEPAPQKKDISALTQDLYGGAQAEEKTKAAPAPAPENAPAKAAKPEPKPEPQQKIVEAEEEPESAKAEEAEEEPVKLPIRAIPIKVKSTDAIKIAGNIARAEDTEVSIAFIPFWKYNYSLDVISKYKDVSVPLNGKGSKMINAINKNVDNAPAVKPIDGVDIPETPYNIQQAVMTEEEAKVMAMKAIIQDHSKEVRFKGTQGEAAFVEHKRFTPKNTDVNMTMEMIYVPFWSIRSHKGYMEINAYDGKPTKTPIDDGAEIL